MHGHDGDLWPDVARHGHEAWWYGPLHLVFVLLLIALLVVGVVWLVRRLQLGAAAVPAPATATSGAIPGAGPAVDPAVAALRMRYARGEVSRDDYLRGMEDLTGSVDRRDDAQAGEDTEPIEP